MKSPRVGVLFLLCVLGSYSMFSFLPTLVRADLVAHWELNEGEGDVFTDIVGRNDGFLPAGMACILHKPG